MIQPLSFTGEVMRMIRRRDPAQSRPAALAAAAASDLSPDAPGLGWQNTCQRHRRQFLATLDAHGIRDVRAAERIRRRVLWAICETFPTWGIRTWVRRECVSCVLEQHSPGYREWVDHLIE